MPNAADIARALQIGAAPMALPTTNTDIAGALNNHNPFYVDPAQAALHRASTLNAFASTAQPPPSPTATLTAFNPTWRDKIGAALMGDGRASPEWAHFVEGLVGSRGLGATGPAVVDATPVGAALGAQEALRAGDPQGAAMAVLPMGGAARTAVKEGAALERAVPKITAYHGTPHDFDQFDIGKIGTGEGNQVFGHGLYFAENPAVARQYRAADTMKGAALRDPQGQARPYTELTSLEQFAFRNALDSGGVDKAIADLRDSIAKGADPWTSPAAIESYKNTLPVLEKWQAAKASVHPGGHLYQVEINADPSHFLDWDKPLSEQHPIVQRAVRDTAGYDPEVTGQEVVKGAFADPKEASQALAAAGIPGIRYLDQGSRGAVNVNDLRGTVSMWEKAIRKAPNDPYAQKMLADSKAALAEAEKPLTSNYVLFDDKHVNITHKNGVKVTPVEHDPFAGEP